MPDAPFSVHCSPFRYQHPVYRAAATTCKARSRGHCQICGREAALEAHHWGRPYPPAEETTADDLTALCVYCHIMADLTRFFEDAGGSPAALCGALSETVASLLLRGVHLPGSPTRVGRLVSRRPTATSARVGSGPGERWRPPAATSPPHAPSRSRSSGAAPSAKGEWLALITGCRRPAVGDVIALFLRTRNEWRTVAVTEVLNGRPGCWRVRKRFLPAAETRSASTTMRDVAA